MRRREFITLLGGAATWPLAVGAQQPERMRRIGVLMSLGADDAEGQARLAAFVQGLQQLGWTDGCNVRIDARWSGGNDVETRKYAAELVALAPDVILASGGTVVGPLLQATRTVPVVFTQTPDPVGAGFVATLPRPGGNATGFMLFKYGISAKWLGLLKEIAPGVTQAAVLRDAAIAQGIGQLGAIQSVAPSFGVEVRPIDVRDAGEIERAITGFARGSNGGLIVTGSGSAIVHRDLIVALAARHKLPAVYYERFFAAGGGLISYGPDYVNQFRRAAGYVDRIHMWPEAVAGAPNAGKRFFSALGRAKRRPLLSGLCPLQHRVPTSRIASDPRSKLFRTASQDFHSLQPQVTGDIIGLKRLIDCLREHLHDCARRAGRRQDSDPETGMNARQSRLIDRRHARHHGGAIGLGNRQRGQFAVLDELEHVCSRCECDRNPTRHQVHGRLGRARIGRNRDIGAGPLIEQLRGKMAGRSHHRSAERECLLVGLSQRDELLQRCHAQARVGRENEWHAGNESDRRKIRAEVESEIG